MGLKVSKLIALVILVVASCSQKSEISDEICKEFYQLNKRQNFSRLLDVSIGARRAIYSYNEDSHRYVLNFNTIEIFDIHNNAYIPVSVFKRGASRSEQDSAFNKLDIVTKTFLAKKLSTNSENLFDSYSQYINAIYDDYYHIKTPSRYNSENIVLEGNPLLGKFIQFTLAENSKVYFVADTTTLSDYWSDYMKRTQKLGDGWFCDITTN